MKEMKLFLQKELLDSLVDLYFEVDVMLESEPTDDLSRFLPIMSRISTIRHAYKIETKSEFCGAGHIVYDIMKQVETNKKVVKKKKVK